MEQSKSTRCRCLRTNLATQWGELSESSFCSCNLEPTQVAFVGRTIAGGSVGAKQEIYNLILQASERRAPVLIVSSELEELIGLCDRILMLQEKQLFHDFRSEGVSEADLLAYCQGVSDGDKSG